jgi:hypothetical protein
MCKKEQPPKYEKKHRPGTDKNGKNFSNTSELCNANQWDCLKLESKSHI